MGFDVNGAIQRAHRIISGFGATVVLRRTAGDRQCSATFVDDSTGEHRGTILNPSERIVLISAYSLSGKLAPNHLLDTLVTFVPGTSLAVEAKEYKIIKPVDPLEANGTIIYWELRVRG